jgi:hypothetical protein
MLSEVRPSTLTRIAIVTFAVAMTAAALVYPGGSWTVTGAQGFSLLRNFWCDLLRSQAINGADNTLGKWLASVAFAALGLGLWPYWIVAASLLPKARGRRVVTLGWISAASLGAMVVLPSDRFPLLHGAVALLGGGLGIGCAWVCVAARLPGEQGRSLRRVAGAATLLLALANAALYVHVAYFGGPETFWQPLVQKLATVALLTWMASTVRAARRRAPALRMQVGR